MSTKICSICNIGKSLSEYSKNRSKKDGYQTLCKKCQSAYHQQWYKENKLKRRKQIKKRKNLIIKANREKYVEYVVVNTCKDCEEADPRVLEFDHTDRTKEYNITQLLFSSAYKWNSEIVQKEIEKCDVVCSNCHRKRTSKKLNWFYENM